MSSLLALATNTACSQPSSGIPFHIQTIELPAGSFMMGRIRNDCWDQEPVHKVTISHSFKIALNKVTVEQYRQFQPDACVGVKTAEPAHGMSWYDAAAFCRWLSQKEGKPYRLPTEAEWEYACKSGKLHGMLVDVQGVKEWCLDWYGDYPATDQVDPVGAASGLARVVRGGPLEPATHGGSIEDYSGPDARCGIAPSFGIQAQVAEPGHIINTNSAGHHNIGFRVVQAEMPAGKPWTVEPPFVEQGVLQSTENVRVGPDPDKPYFIKRRVLPYPPDPDRSSASREAIDAAGLHPSFRGHNHSPSLVVCPNGDLLFVSYTSYSEYESGVSLIAARLRFGADEWDMPSHMIDFPGLNDHAPLLWNDRGRLWLFWGSPSYRPISFPFQWIISEDSGATWSEVHFPMFVNNISATSRWKRQPINTVVRDLSGTLYVPCDANGSRSVLWASHDDGRTWYDPGGRTFGRHTACVLLKDGSLLGLGGKSSDIGGFMPISISRDGARTWTERKSPFPPLGGGQRPSLLRLQSGRLLMAGDWKSNFDSAKTNRLFQGKQGVFFALSEDEGKTWHIKTAPDVRRIGYSVARQSPNGLIHVLMSMPMQEYTFNEAWLRDTRSESVPEGDLLRNSATGISGVKRYTERYANGKIKAVWNAGVGNDGRYLLHGIETWFYEDGSKQYEARFALGRKTGEETLWRPDHSVEWQCKHHSDGSSMWTQYWDNGLRKSSSVWRDFKAEGPAQRWDRNGHPTSSVGFAGGRLRQPQSAVTGQR